MIEKILIIVLYSITGLVVDHCIALKKDVFTIYL